MKPGRQSIILEIISEQDIETQFELMDALAKRGVKSTQATLSRDIKDMNLVKQTGQNGKQKYVKLPDNENNEVVSRLRNIFKDSVVSVQIAQNIVVIKTLPGLASAAASALDKMDINGLVGTIAGDDTVFVAMTDLSSAQLFDSQVESILKC